MSSYLQTLYLYEYMLVISHTSVLCLYINIVHMCFCLCLLFVSFRVSDGGSKLCSKFGNQSSESRTLDRIELLKVQFGHRSYNR